MLMRKDVEFNANGSTLGGWLYTPDSGEGPFPTIVMAHGLSALKEMQLDEYAEVFLEVGFASLVYDHRNCGASDTGPCEIRYDFDPMIQMRDYRHAITYAQSLPEVDSDRIGIWGTSLSGAEVLIAAAIDRRVKCVVSQVPLISGYDNLLQIATLRDIKDLRELLYQDRLGTAAGKAPMTMPIVSVDPEKPGAFPGADSYNYFHDNRMKKGLDWKNIITVRSLDALLELDCFGFMERISPTPLLMIIATEDITTPTDLALKAYDMALEPKELVFVPGNHYGSYIREFKKSSEAARDWFSQHLGT